ncbi:dihydroxyacetone kinase subunit DhaL [Paramicrobacterium sp. CJ85]|uniref:dihydroxyacetone kinase subunit DhaL n=1 Tax=Paramicrobacterium sp. CJ85 TaxID=3445355 RepID=UPI003F638EFD
MTFTTAHDRAQSSAAAHQTGQMDAAAAARWLLRFAELTAEASAELTRLDTAIGDGDHGAVLVSGTAAIVERLGTDVPTTPRDVLAEGARAFQTAAGGAGGALYSAYFHGLSENAPPATVLDSRQLASLLHLAAKSVAERGRALPGDKTMLDVLAPAADTFHAAALAGSNVRQCALLSLRAALIGRAATAPMLARRGRASYLGERSRDHVDPGAASSALLFHALADALSTLPPPHTRSKENPVSTPPRHLFNSPSDVIDDALEGLVASNRTRLARDAAVNVVTRAVPAKDKVGLVSGGGSGHEPLHAGFVGTGMLDAAVCGAVFASPTAHQIHAGTVRADSGAGVLHIVKNYTGDVLNFEIAATLAEEDGIVVESVIVDDDLASDGNDGPGRRGTGAVVVVEKVCGALAEAGLPLSEVADAGRRVVSRSRSLALALSACTHPGADAPAFELGENEVEFGVGIHGERGTARIPFAEADELVEQLVAPLVDDLDIASGASVIAIVNGLGGTSPLELNVAAAHVHRTLAERGITVARALTGSLVTSLDMHGVSVTLTVCDDDILRAWDAPVRTPALTW